MAKLYVTEFQGMAVDAGRHYVPIVDASTTTTENGSSPLSFTTHVESTAFAAGTTIIRVHTDAICSVVIGTTPVATTSNMRMVAGQTEYFGVKAGDKISVVANT